MTGDVAPPGTACRVTPPAGPCVACASAGRLGSGVCDDGPVLSRILDHAGPVLCGLAGLCMIAGLAVDLDSTAAKALMAAAAILFVPGAFLTLVYVRRYYGPGR